MKLSAAGLSVKKYFESCKLEAYPDPGSKDGHPWTIGWGHTGPEVVKGLVWTQQKADDTLIKDSGRFEIVVNKYVKVTLTQGQFDALVLFVFNVGEDAFRNSTLLRKLNVREYTDAANQFLKWIYNDGKVMLGLVRRRTAERALYDGLSSTQAINLAKAVK
jgi:lysozyme